ncbi:hypothetical protein LIER_06407 [Lithospermum erythrorhizon]|uniref:Uncharacterized protein n=1 Tax=Lithospermum erythrorhizon TaxID=34254 RepID=A0AAV3P551_LITER
MLHIPSEYPLEEVPIPSKYPPEKVVKELADRVIDATTLQKVGLYISEGTEVQYGDLVFMPYQDPFANIAPKQEASEDIFREIDEYPASQIVPTVITADENQSLAERSFLLRRLRLLPPLKALCHSLRMVEVACSIAGVEASVPLFASLFSANHRDFDTTLGAKGKLSKNFLADSHPNKVHASWWHVNWFFILGGMGPRVATS